MIQQMALPSYNLQQLFSTILLCILTVAKEFSYILPLFLLYFIANLNCLGINTYTQRIYCVYLLLCHRLFKCFHNLFGQRMKNFLENNSISQKSNNTECTMYNCTSTFDILIQCIVFSSSLVSLFCLYINFCITDYVRLLLIEFQIPAEVQKECVYSYINIYLHYTKQLYFDSVKKSKSGVFLFLLDTG
jgi:hypothetical protein